MMKRVLTLGLLLLIGIGMIICGGCGSKSVNDEKIHVITTIFPIYDWTSNIIGENSRIEVELLLDNGVDMHSYQPTVEDIVKIKKCDLFIYVGGESDEWLSTILSESDTSAVSLSLMDAIGDRILEEEIKEGMSIKETDGESDAELDEHIWLSLRNAVMCSRVIEQSVEQFDGQNAEIFRKNCDAYVDRMKKLDAQYVELFENVDLQDIVVADRFPFVYMTSDYGIDYYAAFPGCYADASASFETLFFLANQVTRLGLDTILCTESSDWTIPAAIDDIATGHQDIMVLDSMQSVSRLDIEDGINYIDIMDNNLQVMYKACSRGGYGADNSE